MNNNIELTNGSFGIKAIIKGYWKDAYIKFLLTNNIQEIELNDGKGWCGENVDFLSTIPNLKSLTLIDFKIKSIEPIHCLSGLSKLELLTYSNTPINFNAFPNLVECSFEWIKGSDSLFKVSNVQKLFVNTCNKKNSDIFSELVNLEELSILNSSIEDIQGLSALKHLKTLRLGNLKKVTSLHGIQNLLELEELEIQKCKGISSISEVFYLNNIRRLLLNDLGNIETIKGIDNLIKLENLLFYESTNIIDGDLFPITRLASLNKISYQNRKHYTHKREEFGKLYR